jgi:hypothetical protein
MQTNIDKSTSLTRKTLIYAHTSSPILTTFDITVGTLMLYAPESRDFVELLLLHIFVVMSCPFLNAPFVLLLETTLSDSHTLDRPVAIFSCQFCTTTTKLLAALRRLEFAVTRICYLTLKYQAKALHYFFGVRYHT